MRGKAGRAELAYPIWNELNGAILQALRNRSQRLGTTKERQMAPIEEKKKPIRRKRTRSFQGHGLLRAPVREYQDGIAEGF